MIGTVLDTNVIVAGLQSRQGASFALLQHVESGHWFQPCISVPLVLEYEAVLRRRLGPDDPRINPVLNYLCHFGDPTEIFFLWRPFLRDPGDEMVLEVAVASRAASIVTHNVRDFGGVEQQFGVRVMRPAEFLIESRRGK